MESFEAYVVTALWSEKKLWYSALCSDDFFNGVCALYSCVRSNPRSDNHLRRTAVSLVSGSDEYMLIDLDMSIRLPAPRVSAMFGPHSAYADKIRDSSAYASPEVVRWLAAHPTQSPENVLIERRRKTIRNVSDLVLNLSAIHPVGTPATALNDVDTTPRGKMGASETVHESRTTSASSAIQADKAQPTIVDVVNLLVRLDVWSFGVTMYEVLTGSPLFANAYDRATADAETSIARWTGLTAAHIDQLHEQAFQKFRRSSSDDSSSAEAAKGVMLSMLDLLKWILDADAQNRPHNMQVVMDHAFFNPTKGSMREHFVVTEIRRALAYKHERKYGTTHTFSWILVLVFRDQQ